MSRIVVIAPHPDDETLGCGGTLLRHKAKGDEVHWLIMTKPDVNTGFDSEGIAARNKEIEKVALEYSFDSVNQLNFSAARLDGYPIQDIIAEVSTRFRELLPQVIYLPFQHDVHSDHRVIFDAVASCVKSFRFPSIRKVRAYETLSETEFNMSSGSNSFSPNLWIDISQFLDKKIEIMNCYVSEVGAHPFPRSEDTIRALAMYRGSTAGCPAAEAFVSLKELILEDD